MPTRRPFRFGVVAAQAPSGQGWIAKAQRAEALGYATFLIPDTLGATLAPLPALAAAAAATRSIRLGTYVLANDFRNPIMLAREAATLDFISGGRFELGLGAGRPDSERENRLLGIPFASGGARVDRLADSISTIKALWAGQAAAAPDDGGTKLFPPPQQPHLPILVAGAGKRLLALAAREANSVALAVRPDATEADFAEKISWLRQAAGERFEQIELNLNLAAVGEQVPPWLAARLQADVAQLARAGAPAVLIGTPEEMADQLLARREALGISYITLSEAFIETLAPVVERLAGR